MLTYKIADKEWEFSEIHKLNYETFVEEIPQHKGNSERSLVDKFHEENNYIICLLDDLVAGMIAIRDKRPFSLEGKLNNLEDFLPHHASICEIRLLSIKKEYRKRKIIQGLFKYLAKYCEEKGYDLALISATTTQQRLYRSLGFEPFGPLVGTNGATFQPMYITPKSYFDFKQKTRLLKSSNGQSISIEKFLFQPGPVGIKKEVERVFHSTPVSHRSEKFMELFDDTQRKLAECTNSRKAQIVTGSGTLSNDMVGAQLSLFGEKGLVLENGEFGRRLIEHSKRFNLVFDTVSENWGDSFDYKSIEKLVQSGDYGWVWFVHCETSTGILNDLDRLKGICLSNGIKLCADCISSLGNIETDLEGIYLATGTSGKGLASYPGLCIVFSCNDFSPSERIPRYLDLGYYCSERGVPYTLSSNLLSALNKSLESISIEYNFETAKKASAIARSSLREYGLEVINSSQTSIPSVVTFKPGENITSLILGEKLENNNIYLSYRSRYLSERNLMQFAFMGEYSLSGLRHSLNCLYEVINS